MEKKKSQKISKRRCISCVVYFCIFKAFLLCVKVFLFFLNATSILFFFLAIPVGLRICGKEGFWMGRSCQVHLLPERHCICAQCEWWCATAEKDVNIWRAFTLFTAYFYACFHSVFVYAKPWDVKIVNTLLFFLIPRFIKPPFISKHSAFSLPLACPLIFFTT